MGSQFGGLGHDGQIHVAEGQTGIPEAFQHVVQKDSGGNIVETGVGIGEKTADVAQGRRSEKGVAQCVNGHIAVGVGHKSGLALDPDAAKPHRKSFSQGMDIVAVAYSVSFHCTVLSFRHVVRGEIPYTCSPASGAIWTKVIIFYVLNR